MVRKYPCKTQGCTGKYKLKGSSYHNLCKSCEEKRMSAARISSSLRTKWLPRPPKPRRRVKDFSSLKPTQRYNRIKLVKLFAKQLGVPLSMLHAPAPSESLLSFPTTTRKRMREVDELRIESETTFIKKRMRYAETHGTETKEIVLPPSTEGTYITDPATISSIKSSHGSAGVPGVSEVHQMNGNELSRWIKTWTPERLLFGLVATGRHRAARVEELHRVHAWLSALLRRSKVSSHPQDPI